MQLFKDDDEGFVSWRDRNQNGYVVNCDRKPKSSYLILHRASCSSINNLRSGYRFWTKDFIKVCAIDANELRRWAINSVESGATLKPCGHCKP